MADTTLKLKPNISIYDIDDPVDIRYMQKAAGIVVGLENERFEALGTDADAWRPSAKQAAIDTYLAGVSGKQAVEIEQQRGGMYYHYFGTTDVDDAFSQVSSLLGVPDGISDPELPLDKRWEFTRRLDATLAQFIPKQDFGQVRETARSIQSFRENSHKPGAMENIMTIAGHRATGYMSSMMSGMAGLFNLNDTSQRISEQQAAVNMLAQVHQDTGFGEKIAAEGAGLILGIVPAMVASEVAIGGAMAAGGTKLTALLAARYGKYATQAVNALSKGRQAWVASALSRAATTGKFFASAGGRIFLYDGLGEPTTVSGEAKTQLASEMMRYRAMTDFYERNAIRLEDAAEENLDALKLHEEALAENPDIEMQQAVVNHYRERDILLLNKRIANQARLTQIQRVLEKGGSPEVAQLVGQQAWRSAMEISTVMFLVDTATLGATSKLKPFTKIAANGSARFFTEGAEELGQDDAMTRAIAKYTLGGEVSSWAMPGNVFSALLGDDPHKRETALMAGILGTGMGSLQVLGELMDSKSLAEADLKTRKIQEEFIAQELDRLNTIMVHPETPSLAKERAKVVYDAYEEASKPGAQATEKLEEALRLAARHEMDLAFQMIKGLREREDIREVESNLDDLDLIVDETLALERESEFDALDGLAKVDAITESMKEITEVFPDLSLHIIESMDHAPDVVIQEMNSRYGDGVSVHGFQYNGQIYLNADAIPSGDFARQKVIHEIAHSQLSKMGIAEYRQSMLEMFELGFKDGTLAQLVPSDYGKVTDKMPEYQRISLAEEYIARVSEKVIKGDQLSKKGRKFWSRFLKWLKDKLGLAKDKDFDPHVAEFASALIDSARGVNGEKWNTNAEQYALDQSTKVLDRIAFSITRKRNIEDMMSVAVAAELIKGRNVSLDQINVMLRENPSGHILAPKIYDQAIALAKAKGQELRKVKEKRTVITALMREIMEQRYTEVVKKALSEKQTLSGKQDLSTLIAEADQKLKDSISKEDFLNYISTLPADKLKEMSVEKWLELGGSDNASIYEGETNYGRKVRLEITEGGTIVQEKKPGDNGSIEWQDTLKMGRGIRNYKELSDEQVALLKRYCNELGLDENDIMVWRSWPGSLYSDPKSGGFDTIILSGDTFPAPSGRWMGKTVLERMTPKAVIAHEYGHMATSRAGKAYEASSLADEVQASLVGRLLPGLSKIERFQLLRDAVERCYNEGIIDIRGYIELLKYFIQGDSYE